ncbi:hypothetical protein Aperf_G00000029489 [Anoplocephala perfoliata]
MITLHHRNRNKTSSSESEKRKQSPSKCVKFNPVDFLKYKDFNNKYCFAVHAITDNKKESGCSPTTVRFLLTALVASKAARGTSADQIIQALSTTNFLDLNSECNNVVDLALNEWALLSTAGLSNMPVDKMDNGRLCRFHSILFVPKCDAAFKAEFHWLLTKRMDFDWKEISRKDFTDAEKWVSTISRGHFNHTFPQQSADSLVLATALQFKGEFAKPLENCSGSTDAFEVSPSEKIKIPMLQGNTKVIYHRNVKRGFHLVGIPFKDRRFAVVFLLPLVPHKFVEVEKHFTEGLDYGLFGRQHPQFTPVHLVIPMFQIQTEVDLCKALPFLGIKDSFEPNRADFSGISDAQNLHVGCGKESALLRVSKSGVRLLSVASLGLSTHHDQFKPVDPFEVPDSKVSKGEEMKEINSFVVNQPFAIFLVDRKSACVLYQARVKFPEPLPLPSTPSSNSG